MICTLCRRGTWCDCQRRVGLAVVEIDPNVRTEGNGTYAGLEDVRELIAPGDHVLLRESEAGIQGFGVVRRIDLDNQLVFLEVDWPSFREIVLGVAPEPDLSGEPVVSLGQEMDTDPPKGHVCSRECNHGRPDL